MVSARLSKSNGVSSKGTTLNADFGFFRTVTDFAEEETYTNMAGGPSDRRFSKWYTSDLQNWLDGNYKVVRADPVDGGNTASLNLPGMKF